MKVYKTTSTGRNIAVESEGLSIVQELITDDKTLLVSDSGKTFNIATDAKVFTLPLIDAGMLGACYRFRNTGADGAIALTIAPASADGINGTVANAAADSVASGALDKDYVLTKATINKGDWVELEAVALTEWYITGGVGIGASEA